MPGNLRDEEAAPINCAGLTTYKALKLSKLWCGQWLAIVGAAGGLGYYAVQYARAMGLKMIAIGLSISDHRNTLFLSTLNNASSGLS